MALANVAVLLARWGYKTLMVDWDLEAPGLGSFLQRKFFTEYSANLKQRVAQQQGIVDILSTASSSMEGGAQRDLSWRELIVNVSLREIEAPLHLLTAGRMDNEYFKKLRNFDVEQFYVEKEGGYLYREAAR